MLQQYLVTYLQKASRFASIRRKELLLLRHRNQLKLPEQQQQPNLMRMLFRLETF